MIASVVSRRFVGREVELKQLHEWRRAASHGRASLILIGGEAGMGKSRLLWEFTRGLTGGRAPLLARAECLERASRPLGPFRSIVSAITLSAPWLSASLTPLARRVCEHLQPYASAESPDTEPLEKADLFAGISELFAKIAKRRATVLTIEDLHWADAATLELLEYLAPRIGTMRLLIVTTLRDDVLPEGSSLAAAVARLERERSVHKISLQPLARPALRVLLESALDAAHPVGEEILRDIEDRSDGNPLWAQELLKNWLERGSNQEELPRSLQGLFAERVAQLNRRERSVLMHAAVLGQRFDAGILAQILECSLERLAPALRRGRELNLIIEEPESNRKFCFRHALTRQAIYESELALSLRPLHGRIARALEALPESENHLDELAYHWWQAANPERARHFNELAGYAALKLCAYAEAGVYLERALSLCAEPLQRARLMSALGTASRSGGKPGAAVRWCLDAATAFANADAPSEGVTPLLFGCAELANANRLDEACVELERFVARNGSRLAPKARGRLRCHLLLLQAYRLDSVAQIPEKASLESELGPLESDALLRYWTARMAVHAQLGELDAWRRAVKEAHAILNSDSDVPVLDQSSTWHFIGLTALQLAQHDEARRAFAASRTLTDSQALLPWRAYLEALRATDAFLTGRLEAAREAALFAAENARFSTARAVLGCVGPLIGLALADKPLVDITVFEEAAARVLAHGLRSQSDLASGSVAATWLASGRTSEARMLLEAAVASAGRRVQGHFIWPLAAPHVRTNALLRLVEVLNRTKANPEHHVAHAVAAHVGAIAAHRTGDRSQSRRLAADAATRYRTLGWPLFQARALELLDEREQAASIYERCGSIFDLRRIARKDASSVGMNAEPKTLLSRREREVATFVARCCPNREVADRLGIGEKTVQSHLTSIYRKLGLRSRAELVAHYGETRSALGASP